MNAPQNLAQAGSAAGIPDGFKPLPIEAEFVIQNGPFYGRLDENRVPVMGFRVEQRHTNPAGICHGGMMMTFADMLLAFTAAMAMGGLSFLPTVSLNGDYVGPSPLGSWVEGRGRVLRLTRSMAFADGLITADGEPAMRVSGIMKITARQVHARPLSSMFG